MASRFFKHVDGVQIFKATTGRRSTEIPSAPEPVSEWIEIESPEYYWRLAEIKKQKRNAKTDRITLVVDLVALGPDAVHTYCMEHYGHGSAHYSTDFIGGGVS